MPALTVDVTFITQDLCLRCQYDGSAARTADQPQEVIAAILFEGAMDGEDQGKPTPAFLWEERHVVPFVKVDKGLETERDGVNLMRSMTELDAVLDRAAGLGVFGTKLAVAVLNPLVRSRG